MEIKGKAHCLFEQSGTFKREFIKLGIPAEDYDIQNNFGETDHVVDLFAEIEKAYMGGQSIFDSMSSDDFAMAFFPCIYFESLSMMAFNWGYTNYKKLNYAEKTEMIIQRESKRTQFYTLLLKLIKVVMQKNIRLVIENPYAMQNFLKQGNFVKNPDVLDMDRTLRGDYFRKPTGFWLFNCEPTHGLTIQKDKKTKTILNSKSSPQAGLCSEDRSMISPDYARNFICDFLIAKPQTLTQLGLFD